MWSKLQTSTLSLLLLSQLIIRGMALATGSVVPDKRQEQVKVIRNDDPLIYYHGRWDTSPGTWW